MELTDISPIYASPKLDRINIEDTTPVPCEQIEYLKQNRTQTIGGLSSVKRCNWLFDTEVGQETVLGRV